MSCHHSERDVLCCSAACACCGIVFSWWVVVSAPGCYYPDEANVGVREKVPCVGSVPSPGNSIGDFEVGCLSITSVFLPFTFTEELVKVNQ